MPVTFYRAVSHAELEDIRQSGRLRIGESSCEGKHLAYSLKDARRWGEMFYGQKPFAVVSVCVRDETAAGFVRWERLDGIGPACFATIEELQGVEIAEVKDES